MQMIQNSSITIIESMFLFTYGSFLCYLARCKKKTDCIRANKILLFCYTVYSTEMGKIKKYITSVENNNKYNYELK